MLAQLGYRAVVKSEDWSSEIEHWVVMAKGIYKVKVTWTQNPIRKRFVDPGVYWQEISSVTPNVVLDANKAIGTRKA